MSTREQKHAVVDANPSTAAEIVITQNLRKYCDAVAPLEVGLSFASIA